MCDIAQRTLRLGLLALILLPASNAAAYELDDKFAVGVHLRTRFVYSEGRDGDMGNDPLEYVENRARLWVDARPFEWGRAFFQLQDVRVWGEELDTLLDFTANGLDVHQAFVDLMPFDVLTLRVGRQEISWEGQRLVGAVAWTSQARSFDAARVIFAWQEHLWAEAFFAFTADTESVFPGIPTNANVDRQEVVALNARYRLLSGPTRHADVSITGIVDLSAALERTRFTVGARHEAAFGPLRYRLEGFYQGGDVAGADLSAFMLGARAGVNFEEPGISVDFWADYLSGGSAPSRAARRTFDTLYATNHKFYGFADFFLNLPVHTQGKGLVDLALKSKLQVHQLVGLGLDVHHMLAPNPQGGPGAWGWEVDFTVLWKPYKPVGVFVGVFTFVPQGAMIRRLGGGDDPDVGFYASLQADL